MGRWSAKRATCGEWTMLVLAAGALGACTGEAPDASGADDTAQAQQELAAAAAADPATMRRVQVVSPVLKCVDVLSNKQLRGHFGYTNSSAAAVAIPVGPFNQFSPAPTNRGQPTSFAAGAVADVVQVPFASSGTLLWVLGTHVATATRLSPRCPVTGAGGSGAGGAAGTPGAGGMNGVGGSGAGGAAGTPGVGGMNGAGGLTGAGGARMCPSSCDDLNPCTTDSCGAGTNFDCAHDPVAAGTACDDGNACTIGDSCESGQCTPGTSVTCPAATGQCQVAVCDPASGACTTASAPDGAACSNGQFCTVNETCTSGVCGGGSSRVCPADPTNECAIPFCFSDSSGNGGFCFFNQKPTNTPCTTASGQPGVCENAPSFSCRPVSCEECSNFPDVRFPPEPISAACTAVCTDSTCKALYNCLVAPSHPDNRIAASCLSPGGTADACWCGTNPCTCATDATPPTEANGPCLPLIIAAAGTSDPALIQQRLHDTSFAVGRAFSLAECRAQHCSRFCPIAVPATPPPDSVCTQPATPICTGADQCRLFDPATGTCSIAAPDGSGCDDGDACTAGDRCQAGACVAGPVCPPTRPCDAPGVCSASTHSCVAVARPDGASCDVGGRCDNAGVCDAGVCRDLNAAGVCRTCDQCSFGPQSGEANICSASVAGCANCNSAQAGCAGLASATDRANCEAVYSCMAALTHPGTSIPGSCINQFTVPFPCWCGSNNSFRCIQQNQANGPCLAQVQAAAGSTDPNVINQQFQSSSSPLGRAVNLVICRTSSCSDECAVPMGVAF